ncbi:MAG: ABC transporter six-transmembrane domain-containing protein [Ahrensia sp.]|nr:ABC transporter six-transmembrane domain-containing protein [Ahrensia sp.]
MIDEHQITGGSDPALLGARLSLGTLFKRFPLSIGITWLLVLFETALIAFAPLYIGYAIDGLLAQESADLLNLSMLLGTLVVIGVARRIYDTRAYGTIRLELCRAVAAGSKRKSVSITNARLGMGRELADFLEEDVPHLLSSIVHLGVALLVLGSFHPVLLASALSAGFLVLLIYALVHRRFFNLNGDLNFHMERQVGVLSSNQPKRVFVHLTRLRKAEVRISDTEAFTYGAMFAVLVSFIVFNLWFVTGEIEPTAGQVFSIVSYSWEFVEAAIVLPATLQGWSRLSEITQRINATD